MNNLKNTLAKASGAFVRLQRIWISSKISRKTKLIHSVSVVLLNSPILSSYFSLKKFERNLFLIFSSLLCLINSHILITKDLILYK